jgi:hypothetical protein
MRRRQYSGVPLGLQTSRVPLAAPLHAHPGPCSRSGNRAGTEARAARDRVTTTAE